MDKCAIIIVRLDCSTSLISVVNNSVSQPVFVFYNYLLLVSRGTMLSSGCGLNWSNLKYNVCMSVSYKKKLHRTCEVGIKVSEICFSVCFEDANFVFHVAFLRSFCRILPWCDIYLTWHGSYFFVTRDIFENFLSHAFIFHFTWLGSDIFVVCGS